MVTLHEKSEVDDGAELKASPITVKGKLLKASRHTECVQEPIFVNQQMECMFNGPLAHLDLSLL